MATIALAEKQIFFEDILLVSLGLHAVRIRGKAAFVVLESGDP